jgi:SAM-dependent methyltransferase
LSVEKEILSLLQFMSLDKYAIHKLLGNKSIFIIGRAISSLQAEGRIHIVKYRKNVRTGNSIPVYSIIPSPRTEPRFSTCETPTGITSERSVEYEFVLSNLVSHNSEANLLDVGCSTFTLSNEIRKLGLDNWRIIGIDIANGNSSRDFPLMLMDARKMGFKDEIFDQVLCLFTLEHIGLGDLGYGDSDYDIRGDIHAMTEIHRILKPKGTGIITIPYGNLIIKKQEYRVYNDELLSILISKFRILKKRFFVLKKGLWKECDEIEANNFIQLECSNQKFHSDIFACLLLGKK